MRKVAKDWRVYLEDIRSAIGHIDEYTATGKGRFFADRMVKDAVIRELSIIGEAAAKLPSMLKARHPKIPWKQVVGMRNVLIHDYAETNVGTVWLTVERDLPPLKQAVAALLQKRSA